MGEVYGLSQRRACRALSVCRSSVRYKPIKRADEDETTEKIIELASNYGRYGYRRITMMLRAIGLLINHKTLIAKRNATLPILIRLDKE